MLIEPNLTDKTGVVYKILSQTETKPALIGETAEQQLTSSCSYLKHCKENEAICVQSNECSKLFTTLWHYAWFSVITCINQKSTFKSTVHIIILYFFQVSSGQAFLSVCRCACLCVCVLVLQVNIPADLSRLTQWQCLCLANVLDLSPCFTIALFR